MAQRLKANERIQVEEKDGKPHKVQGRLVSYIIDSYRITPNWWEGYRPHNYWLIQVKEKALKVYQVEASESEGVGVAPPDEEGWFFSKYVA